MLKSGELSLCFHSETGVGVGSPREENYDFTWHLPSVCLPPLGCTQGCFCNLIPCSQILRTDMSSDRHWSDFPDVGFGLQSWQSAICRSHGLCSWQGWESHEECEHHTGSALAIQGFVCWVRLSHRLVFCICTPPTAVFFLSAPSLRSKVGLEEERNKLTNMLCVYVLCGCTHISTWDCMLGLLVLPLKSKFNKSNSNGMHLTVMFQLPIDANKFCCCWI